MIRKGASVSLPDGVARELARSPRPSSIEKSGIGGSEASAACGYDPYLPSLWLYLDKIGELPREERIETANARLWGKLAEPSLARWYELQTGRRVRKVRRTIVHPIFYWMFVHLDYEERELPCDNVECKTSRYEDGWGTPGTDEVPRSILLQATHQMIVSGKRRTWIPAKVGRGTPEIYVVEFDPILANEVIEREREFWRFVERKEMPPPDWDHAKTPELVTRWSKTLPLTSNAAEPLDLTGGRDQYLELALDYVVARDLGTKIEKVKKLLKAKLEWAMGDAEIATLYSDRTTKRLSSGGDASVISEVSAIRKLIKKPEYHVPPSEHYEIRFDFKNYEFPAEEIDLRMRFSRIAERLAEIKRVEEVTKMLEGGKHDNKPKGRRRP